MCGFGRNDCRFLFLDTTTIQWSIFSLKCSGLLIVDGSPLERGQMALAIHRTGRMKNRPAIRCLSSSWSDPSVEMEWRTDSESSLADACHLYSHSTTLEQLCV